MEWLSVGALSALWFGILTSISPCPLATNIAAMSYIGKRVSSPRKVFSTGILYTLGRMSAYVVLAVAVILGLAGAGAARFLERYMSLLLGPLLILIALFLLEAIKFSVPGAAGSARIQKWAARSGFLAPFLLGVLFAVSMCPVSVGLFFLGLVPLSMQYQSNVVLPLIYGLGTGLPVIAFAIVIGFCAGSLGKVFHRLTQFEYWARRVTGAVFILAGLYTMIRNWSGYVSVLRPG